MRPVANQIRPHGLRVLQPAHLFFLIAIFLLTMVSARAQAQLSLSAPSVAFTAKQVVGTTSTTKPVTVTNNGASGQAFIATASGDFTETDGCGGSIAGGGGTCVLSIAFAPTVAGSVTGAVTLRDVSGNLLAFVTTTGTGLAPVTVAPASLAFGSVPLGTTSVQKTFKITNNSASPVTINTPITASADYNVVSQGTCATALAHAASCTVAVTVTPTSATTNGAIVITDNAANAIPLVVKLSATGTGTVGVPLTFSKPSLAFKAVIGGTSAAQTITVSNTSGASLTMGTVTVSNQFNIPSINDHCSGATLVAAGTCTFQITFAPTFVGSIGGSVSVAYTGNNSPQLISLSGTASDNLTAAPTKLAYISQGVGTVSTSKPVKITNNSATGVTLSSIYTSGDYQIATTGTTCTNGITLLALKSCTLEVQFAPTQAGTIVGSITVSDTSSPNPLLIYLSGVAANTASLAPNPTSAHQGSSATILITGTNTHFSASTTANFGPNITVGTLTINGPGSASVPITIDNVATLGARNITMTTGAEVAGGTFTVVAGVPQVTQINPNIVPTTATSFPVTVTGAFTTWSSTTKANFGPGVSVGGATAGTFGPVTVNSGTSLTASVTTSSASLGFRTVQIQTPTQTLTVPNGIDVETCGSTAPTIIQVSPANGAQGLPLNTKYQIQFSVPMNSSSFTVYDSTHTSGSVRFWDGTTNKEIPYTISFDASNTIASLTPSVVLPSGRTFYVYLSYNSPVKDSCGNNLGAVQDSFNTAYNTNTAGPSLTGNSPENGDTSIPLNGNAATGTPVVLQFSEAIDPVTVQVGFSMTTGGNAVPGNFSYSTDDKTVTFKPVSPLSASTTYTVSYGASITDSTGNALTNPGSFSFTTGTAADTTTPQVVRVDPANNANGVGVNVAPRIVFNEPVNQLTIPSTLAVYYENGSLIVPATVTVSADRMSATVTPASALQSGTYYGVYICGYIDIAGNSSGCFNSVFYTGTSGDTTHPIVSTINPSNGQSSVPTNTIISAVMSDDIDPTSVTNSSITLTPSVAGTVSLASDGVTLTFTPSVALTASTTYNVSVSGLKDTEGNTMSTAFTSTFMTGSTPYGSGSFTLTSATVTNGNGSGQIANNATGVLVTSPVVFNMSNLIDAASVNTNSVQVYLSNTSAFVAGTFSVTNNVVTFTPLSPYPPNTKIGMYISGLKDEAGNQASVSVGTFTTANTPDTTTPTVTITPADGTTNVGLDTQIVLAFSKSMNPATINTPSNLAIFNGEHTISYSPSISQDNRTVILNAGRLPAGATLTVALSNGLQDLSGNALQATSSQFTLTQDLSNATPYVTVMRPGNGATGVPANTLITLFTNVPLNVSTVAGAMHVTDNGVVVAGSVQVSSNGQAIVFTPSGTFGAGDIVQVHLDSSALSTTGVGLSAFSQQFTVAGSPSSTTTQVITVNPFPSATNVPLNAKIQVEFNQAIQATSVTCNGNSGSVRFYQYSTSTALTPNCTVSGGVITIAPTSNLVSGSQYQVYIDYNSNVTDTNGKVVQAYAYNFTAGSATDTAAPTIVSLAPIDNSTNIGTNTLISVNFNKAINPVSVTGSTIQLLAGTTVEAPASILFSSDFTRVTITPQAALPTNTLMTLTISGVTSQAGVSVVTKTTHFTTGALDFSQAYVVNSSVLNSQTNVPVNSSFSMQFSKPMDIGSFTAANVNVYGGSYPSGVPATVTWSADQTAIFIVPTSVLGVGTQYCLESYYMTDLSGNSQQNFIACFTTAFSSNANPPTVLDSSPENTQTQVPTNSPVQVLFSEPVQPTSAGQITLKNGANLIAVTSTWSNGNQLLTLTPGALLAANTTYTLVITGVKDTAGNQMTATVTNTFTTGATFDVVGPRVVKADPVANSLGVGINVAPKLLFSERINPLSINNTNVVQFSEYYSGLRVPITTSMSSDRMTLTVTPTAALKNNTSYYLYLCSYYDVAGNAGQCLSSAFTTGSGADTSPTTVSTINPANGQSGPPLNTVITAVMSDDIDPTSVNSSSLTVTPQGGSALAGTVSLASDGVTLTFVPSALLSVNTVYNVSVGGFLDTEGNTVTAFNSSFTTGATGYGNGSFTLTFASVTNGSGSVAASGATGVVVTSPVVFTMSNFINPASVNPNSVRVYVYNTNAIVSGSYSVSDKTVTFTPVAPYPPSTQMGMYIVGLTDEAANADNQFVGTFTTATTADTTAPTVTISPSDGTSNVGVNTQVVMTFSKSINPSTISYQSVNLLNGDKPLNASYSISQDNRTVVLSYNPLPAGATITATATHLIQDLSGNALADTTSQFTVTPPVSTAAPYVVSMRPGNGASNVPTNTVITLFTSAPMNSSTLPGALHVIQNGALISGSTTIGGNGQNIQFTPSSALSAATVTHVLLDSTAQDVYGNNLSSFQEQFTTQGPPASTTSQVVTVNPFPSATNVPLNTVIQVQYDQPIQASSVTCTGNTGSVRFYEYSTNTALTPNCTVSGGVITITPVSNLVSGSQYLVYVDYNSNVTNTNGVTVQAYAYNFTAGTATDTVAPIIKTVAPADTSTNIGTNAGITVRFDKTIDPVSVTGTTIQLSSTSTGTLVPASISFAPDYTKVTIIPQAPLPSSTQMTIAINGVTSQAGVAVASKTTHFTTMAGADYTAPYVIHTSVDSNQTVGTNAVIAMQFNKAMDQGSYNSSYPYIQDNTASANVAFKISLSSDLTTVFLTPTVNLTPGHSFQMCSYYLTDLSGNQQQGFCLSFLSGSGTDTTGPVVQQASPPSSFTGTGTNAVVAVLFNTQIAGSSTGSVALKQGGTVIPTSVTLFDGDQGVQLTPLKPLSPGTTYTINVTGVTDTTGNAQSAFTATSFTTGTGIDLVPPTFVSSIPTSGANSVPVNTTVKIVFSEAMDPACFDVNNSFTLRDPSSTIVPATVSFSADFKTVTLAPNVNLAAATHYNLYYGYFTPLYDLAGNPVSGSSIGFTTQ